MSKANLDLSFDAGDGSATLSTGLGNVTLSAYSGTSSILPGAVIQYSCQQVIPLKNGDKATITVTVDMSYDPPTPNWGYSASAGVKAVAAVGLATAIWLDKPEVLKGVCYLGTIWGTDGTASGLCEAA